MAHFDKHKILSDDQHGYCKRCSCETQLIVTLNDLPKGLSSKQQIDAVLLDFFGYLTEHPISAFSWSYSYGIPGKVLQWIEGQFSSASLVTYDVPQSTVLSPLLFLGLYSWPPCDGVFNNQALCRLSTFFSTFVFLHGINSLDVTILSYLGSVHKYFGGGAGQLKIFVVKLFWPPPSQAAKTFWTPLNKCKNFFDPPPHCYMYNISVFPQHQFIWYAPQVYQYYW